MLTSKEIIERTGISRATLNNYIASGLVPRPQVLPPGPEHGAAPRIGYFPDDTVARIETIHRLKREGWSIQRIAEQLAAHPSTPAPSNPQPSPPAPRSPLAQQLPSVPSVPGFEPISAPGLWLREVGQPAYLVNDSFRLLWQNEEARSGRLSPLAGREAAAGANLFGLLLQVDEPLARDAILRFHLAVAKDRGHGPSDLFKGLGPEQVVRLEALYGQTGRPDAALVSHERLPAAGAVGPRRLYAVHFRDGVLFAYAPDAEPAAVAAAPGPRGAATAPSVPAVTPVAVLVTALQDAAGLWVKLTAQEYFELLHEVGTEVDRIFRAQQGQPGRYAGEVLNCYFLPRGGGDYLLNALAAAQQVREAMRQVSQRWKARKGWDVDLCMNTGVAEGQDWIVALGDPGDLRVRGDAADSAEALSRCSRMGAILVTRNLLGKLQGAERQGITYGVPRLEGTRAEAPLLFTFARLAEIAAPAEAPSAVAARFADLAVAELLDLHSPNPRPGPHGAG